VEGVRGRRHGIAHLPARRAHHVEAAADRAAASLAALFEASVSEIAIKFGFSDSPYFTRSFKRETGVTTSEFRRRHGAT
jgi:AraC-like DNA-binding protein